MLHQWFLYEVIKDILPFVLNTNGLWAIFGCWVISKTVLGVFWKNWNSDVVVDFVVIAVDTVVVINVVVVALLVVTVHILFSCGQ